MTDHDQMENLLRSSLAERAQDVEVTPALYAEVQRRATRGAWLRRGLVLAGATAVVVGAVTVGPSLLPEQVLPPILEQPESERPTEEPTEGPGIDVALRGFANANMVVAVADEEGGSSIHLPGREVVTDVPVVSLVTSAFPAEPVVVAVLEDGRIGVIAVGGSGSDFEQTIDASPNGGAAVPTAAGDGVAWIEGTDLHVLPALAGSQVRILPLEGDLPEDLRIEQWFGQADAQVVLATDTAGRLWSLPMDEAGAFDTAPTAPGFVLAEQALDGALLEDLSRADLGPNDDGDTVSLVIDGVPFGLAFEAGLGTELVANGQRVAVFERASGAGALYELFDSQPRNARYSWVNPLVQAAAPLGQAVTVPTGSAEAPPLTSDAPLIGTDGVEVVVRTSDGGVSRRQVYPISESEAVLGDLAVRPGSTSTDGLLAVESTSEGETSVRFVALDGTVASPVGDVIVADGPVTGLVWDEGGSQIAWTDDAGLHVASVDAAGLVTEEVAIDSDDSRPVIDWVWTDDDGQGRTSGYLSLRDGLNGTEFLGVDRFSNDELVMIGSLGARELLIFDTHVTPGGAVGPTVSAAVSGDVVDLSWSGDGDQFGPLEPPGPVGSEVRVDVSGGQVLVLGSDAQLLVTFAGEVVSLPALTDWDVLD